MAGANTATDPRLAALWHKVEAFFARVRERYPAELQCRAGCDGCCQRRLTVTAVEAAAIRGWLAALDQPERSAIAARAQASARHPQGPCAALQDDGRCGIYPVRPLVCRSHGVPLRMKEEAGPGLTVCPLNFTGHPLPMVDADCVLDQTTLSTVLYAIDAAWAREQAAAVPAGRDTVEGATRVDLAELLSAG
jgi:Fe-S-cluster containining protein